MKQEMKMDYVIEDGIEIPKPRRGRKGEKYPLSRLLVGQSFFVAGQEKSFLGSIARSNKYAGKKFITRKVEGGVRVWRIE
jgi:hypothetical protein